MIASLPGFGEVAGFEGTPNPPLAGVKMNRVVNPPSAITHNLSL